jgi:hypothetical protein
MNPTVERTNEPRRVATLEHHPVATRRLASPRIPWLESHGYHREVAPRLACSTKSILCGEQIFFLASPVFFILGFPEARLPNRARRNDGSG